MLYVGLQMPMSTLSVRSVYLGLFGLRAGAGQTWVGSSPALITSSHSFCSSWLHLSGLSSPSV